MALTFPATRQTARPDASPPDASPTASGGLRPLRVTLAAAALVPAALVGGFLLFLASLERSEPKALPRGDAIVALTGGAERIHDAVGWLAQGHGERLLISGVDTQVKLKTLTQQAPPLRDWLACCVDLGHQALNTVGNAEETRRWAVRRGYRSLLVVTSNYHMPRAMLELKRHMPDVRLIAAPVVTQRLQELRLWRDPALLRTLGQEYAKFLVAYARASVTRPSLTQMAATQPNPTQPAPTQPASTQPTLTRASPAGEITAHANRRRAS